MEKEQEQMNKLYESLPSDLRRAMDSVDIGNTVADIGYKYGLTIDNVAELMDQTSLTILGINKTFLFSSNLVKNLGIDSRTANSITSEINDKVFKGIRLSLFDQTQKIASIVNNKSGVVANSNDSAQSNKVQLPKTQFQPLPAIQTPFKNPITSSSQQITQQTNVVADRFVVPQKPSNQVEPLVIEKPPVVVPQYKENNLDRDNILKSIENPSKEVSMTDRLLSNPVSTTEKVEIKKPLIPKPVVDNKPYGLDPYREEI